MSLGFYFDMTRCSGCAACRTACQDRFDLLAGCIAIKRALFLRWPGTSQAFLATIARIRHVSKIVRRELCSRTRTASCCTTMMCASAVKRA